MRSATLTATSMAFITILAVISGSLAEKEESLQIHDHVDFDTYEDFLTEYYHKETKNHEVQFIQQHFPNIDTSLTTEQYTGFLKQYLNENLKELEAHEDVQKEHDQHNEVLARGFMEESGKDERESFELHDAFADIVEGEFMFYLNTVEVKTPQEIEEEDQAIDALDKEVDEEVENLTKDIEEEDDLEDL